MKIAVILGARPQFIKAYALSLELRKRHDEVIIHTGQHYDDNMSKIFFAELNLPNPKYFLAVGSHMQGAQTGMMLSRIENVLIEENPDCVVVLGDTNSTLAGALAAVKLNIPVAHVEAGLRSFSRKMPEEINRIIVDHVSNLLFIPSEIAKSNLTNEGVLEHIYSVGDIMYDSILQFSQIALEKSHILDKLNLSPSKYYLATIHRAENTDDANNLKSIINILNELDKKVVLPLHPRTKSRIDSFNIIFNNNIKIIEPVGYLDIINLITHSHCLLTDSGGMQKEAYYLSVPCITLRNETEWIETVEAGWNILTGINKDKIFSALESVDIIKNRPRTQLYGKGNAARLIVSHLEAYYNHVKNPWL